MATQAKKRKTHKSPQKAQETQEETSETNNGTITLSRKEKKRLKKANKLSKKGNGATNNSVHVQRDWSDEEDDNEEDVNSPNNTPPEATNKTPNNEETEQTPDDDANSTPETVNTSTLTDNADTTHEPTNNNNNNNNNNETALEPATLFSATLLEKILKPMSDRVLVTYCDAFWTCLSRRHNYFAWMPITIPSFKFIICRQQGRVGVIQLNRPKALNALCRGMMEEVRVALALFQQADASCGCIILTGCDRAFAAGADITELADQDAASFLKHDPISVWEEISSCVIPIVAAVNGFALGGGCEIAMMCDIILASAEAKFGQPEIKLGTIPGAGGTQRLTRAVGKSLAMDLILTGRVMPAQEALQRGLVSHVYPADQLMDEALKLASQIASQPKAAAILCKRSVNRAYETTLENGVRWERDAFHASFALPDRKEGMKAFLEKRKPLWSHL
eukprot:g67152.t1